MAPVGIVIVIVVSLQEFTITGTPLSVTRLPPCTAPKPEPERTICWPIEPVVAEALPITGALPVIDVTET